MSVYRYRNPMQAWRAIARKLLDSGRVYAGLCREIDFLSFNQEIDGQTRTFMRRQLHECPRAVYPVGTCAEERAMLAAFFAEDAPPSWMRHKQAARRNERIKRRMAQRRHAFTREVSALEDAKLAKGADTAVITTRLRDLLSHAAYTM